MPNDQAASRGILSRRQLVQGVGVAGVALVAGCGRLPWQAEPAKVPRIGYLGGGSAPTYTDALDQFRQGLRELSHVEGQNLVIEYSFTDGRLGQARALAAELVRLNLDL